MPHSQVAGVDGHIHLKAGEDLMDECKVLGGCNSGEAKLTRGYNLPAKFIIHTVGPTLVEVEILQNAYLNSLNLAVANGIRTIAFPCISTGVKEFPSTEACKIVLHTVRPWLSANRHKIDRIVFCVYSLKNEAVYQALLPSYFPIS